MFEGLLSVPFIFQGRPGTASVRPGEMRPFWVDWWNASVQVEACRNPLRMVVEQAVYAHFQAQLLQEFNEVYHKLSLLGWNTSPPPSGIDIDVIEPGSTGIFRACPDGAGGWQIPDREQTWLCPRPFLWRRVNANG